MDHLVLARDTVTVVVLYDVFVRDDRAERGERGKHGELACQYVRLEEHEKGYGCFGAQGCDGFKTRAGLRDDTPMLLKAEPGCC